MSTFGGDTFSPSLDAARLTKQLARVQALMRDREWRTLAEIGFEVGAVSEAGVSARLRDLRKAKHGGYTVERRRVPGARGLHQYRLLGAGQLRLEEAA